MYQALYHKVWLASVHRPVLHTSNYHLALLRDLSLSRLCLYLNIAFPRCYHFRLSKLNNTYHFSILVSKFFLKLIVSSKSFVSLLSLLDQLSVVLLLFSVYDHVTKLCLVGPSNMARYRSKQPPVVRDHFKT